MADTYAPRVPVKVLLGGGFFLLFVLSLIVRWSFWPHISNDFRGFVSVWYEHFLVEGFSGLATVKSDYNPPYLFMLYLLSLVKLTALDACKVISCVFDYVLAYSVFRLVRSLGKDLFVSALACCAVLFLPAVFLNSAMWGQCDAIYSAFLLLSVAAFIRRADGWGWAWWALAFVFKLQAMIFLPVLVYLWFEDRSRSVFAPLVIFPIYVLSIAPSYFAGKPFVDLMMIYSNQVTQYTELTYNAPTVYQWIPQGFYSVFLWGGIAVSCGALAMCFMALFARKRVLSAYEIVLVSAFVLFLVTFLLPKMHERYFFPAEIFVFVLSFVRGRFALVAIAAQIIALFVYHPYLFYVWPPIAMNLLPFGVLGIIVYLGYEIYCRQGQKENGSHLVE